MTRLRYSLEPLSLPLPPDSKALFDLLECILGAPHEVTVSFEGVDLNEVDETGVELQVEHVHYGQQSQLLVVVSDLLTLIPKYRRNL